MTKLTRHDIPNTVKNVITTALEHNVIDAIEIYSLASEHGDDWQALVTDLCQAAFTLIHIDLDAHRAVVQAAEKHWVWAGDQEIVDLGESDKFNWAPEDLVVVFDKDLFFSADPHPFNKTMPVPVITPTSKKKDVTTAAKEVRKVLKETYPGVKFSVRSHRYSGGSSVEIWWTDGPTTTEVKKLTDGFHGYENGYYNDYVTTQRSVSTPVMKLAAEAAKIQYGLDHTPEIKTATDGTSPYCEDYTRVQVADRNGEEHTEPVCDQIHRAAHSTSTYEKKLSVDLFNGAFPN